MNIMDEAGIWQEVKVMSKAKTPTKAGMPHFDGHELETLLQQRQRLLDVVFPGPSIPYVVSARFLWQRYDEMVDAWSAEPDIKNADANEA
jgi:hypothetical protein